MNIVYRFLAVLALLLAQNAYALDPGEQPTTRQDSTSFRSPCSATSFKEFLSIFLNEEKVRKTNFSLTLEIYDLVLQDADQAYPYKKSIISKEKASPIIDKFLTSEKNVSVSWVKRTSAEVLFFDDQRPEIERRYLFSKNNGCWTLVAVFNELIPPPKVLSERSQEKAKNCLRAAERHENRASQAADKRAYDLALYAYLCAAQNGSAQAAVRGAQLATSGQSRMLPSNYVEMLFLIAADEGLFTAMTALAELKCGDLSICAEPRESYGYLSRAILAGDREAINILGVWLEQGTLGKSNASHALSCYKLAADRGSKLGAENFKRLSVGSHNIKPTQCPVDDFSIVR